MEHWKIALWLFSPVIFGFLAQFACNLMWGSNGEADEADEPARKAKKSKAVGKMADSHAKKSTVSHAASADERQTSPLVRERRRQLAEDLPTFPVIDDFAPPAGFDFSEIRDAT